jgi:hypothetical protein
MKNNIGLLIVNSPLQVGLATFCLFRNNLEAFPQEGKKKIETTERRKQEKRPKADHKYILQAILCVVSAILEEIKATM